MASRATALFFTSTDRLAEVFRFSYVRMFADGRAEISQNFDGEIFVLADRTNACRRTGVDQVNRRRQTKSGKSDAAKDKAGIATIAAISLSLVMIGWPGGVTANPTGIRPGRRHHQPPQIGNGEKFQLRRWRLHGDRPIRRPTLVDHCDLDAAQQRYHGRQGHSSCDKSDVARSAASFRGGGAGSRGRTPHR